MTNEVIIVLGIVIATVVGIAISFFKTKSTTDLDTSQSWAKPTTSQELEQIKKELEDIKQKLQDQVED